MSVRASLVPVLAVAVLCTAASPAAAQARGIVLGFGSTYIAAGGGQSTHRGVDVEHPAGSDVPSPVAGEISFAGRVPSVAGGTMLAVSIETQQGTVTLMPFRAVEVERGERVEPGDVVGTLAECGDPSTVEPHLHVGLKRGGMYLDPGSLLMGAVAAGDSSSEPVPAAAVAAEPAVVMPSPRSALAGPIPVTNPAPASAPTIAPASSSGNVAAEQGPGVEIGFTNAPNDTNEMPTGVGPQAGQVSEAAPTRIGRLSIGEAQPRVVRAPTAGVLVGAPRPSRGLASPLSSCLTRITRRVSGDTVARGAVRRSPTATVADMEGTAGSAVAASRASGGARQVSGRVLKDLAPVVLDPRALCVPFLSVLAVILLFSRRALERRLLSATPVSDRFGSMLQHLRAGDTLCGLTSCSGLLPSQSRSRLAQRR